MNLQLEALCALTGSSGTQKPCLACEVYVNVIYMLIIISKNVCITVMGEMFEI